MIEKNFLEFEELFENTRTNYSFFYWRFLQIQYIETIKEPIETNHLDLETFRINLKKYFWKKPNPTRTQVWVFVGLESRTHFSGLLHTLQDLKL